MTVEVKICGLTRPADAAAAVRAGASYLGIVLAGGPRMVGVAQAASIVAAAGTTPVLGVFGRQPPDEILRMCHEAGLSGAQLHGAHSRTMAAALRRGGLRVWRVVHLSDVGDLDTLADAALDTDAVLVEPRVAHAIGGAGVPLALDLAREARRRLAGHRMVLAGGLTPETVAEAVALVGPEVIDVSSGVEYQPGIKDPDKIARFLEAVLGHSSTN